MGEASDNLMVLCETSLDTIENVLENVKPQIVVIDSIQTMYREEVGACTGQRLTGKRDNSCSYSLQRS